MAMQARAGIGLDGETTLAFARRHSPYLARLIEAHPALAGEWKHHGPEKAFAAAQNAFADEPTARRLRLRKQQVALVTALADLSGQWPLERVTAALSAFAEASVQESLEHLLQEARQAKLLGADAAHGIVVLGMGKLGGGELNYSSDIDLILLYDADRLPYTGRQSMQGFMTRLAQNLVSLLQDRTPDGYVFRTDLRLRPDPASTPLAVTTSAAIRYYESVGQNWERAALIKARAIAGDMDAARRFLAELQPFLWRTHLDFAAVADILSIKRQMQARYDEAITLAGHNVKTGRGGIREIEFLAQIHQLIWGGRRPSLRLRPTVAVLWRLAEEGLIPAKTASRLERSYRFLRTLEHRLQMVADEQTHRLPESTAAMEDLARFMRFHSREGFERTVARHLHRVHRYFSLAFTEIAGAGPLGGGRSGKLVFTGVDPDADTLDELAQMGFADAAAVAHAIADWHKGHRRCTRTARSRELLTELVPDILRALAETSEPDAAFRHFDAFLSNLPSGVQLFSLFASNPSLLSLTADILGSAPALGESLSRHPELFDAVMTGRFFDPLPDAEGLRRERDDWLRLARDDEDHWQRLAAFQKEKQFQAGVQLLKGIADAPAAGHFLSDLADMVVDEIGRRTQQAFCEIHGGFGEGGLILIALGKLGSRELTFGSDLDLIFLYDAEGVSDGAKPLNPITYFTRLAQRIMGRLTALGRLGRLYDIDTRLRPFGADGPIAVSFDAFTRYHDEAAWIFERLALTRARILHSGGERGWKAGQVIARQLTRPIPPSDMVAAIADMRGRLALAYADTGIWDVKHAPGGLMDIDFLLQQQVLLGSRMHPELRVADWPELPGKLLAAGRMDAGTAQAMSDARRLQTTLLFHLRLMVDGRFRESTATKALKHLLAAACGSADFEALKKRLESSQSNVREMIERFAIAK